MPDAIIVFDSTIRILYANQAALEFIGTGSNDPADTVLDAASLVHPGDLDSALVSLGPILEAPGARGSARVRITNGEEIRPSGPW